MLTTHTATAAPLAVAADKLAYFRFGALGTGVVVSNDQGRWHHLDRPTFRAFLRGEIEPGHPEYDALAAGGFLRDALALDEAASAVRARRQYVGLGPSLHTIFLDGPNGALPIDVAKDVLDLAMLSTSSSLEIRLVASRYPTDLIGFLIQVGTEKNRYEGKAITWRLRTNLGALPEGAEAWLVEKRVVVQTRLDGPAAVHDAQRAAGAPEHHVVVDRIARLHAVPRAKADWRVQADVHIGTANVGAPDAVLDELVARGVRRYRLFQTFDGPHAITLGAWSAFYGALLDRSLALDAPPVEAATATLLTRLLRREGGADASRRSPCSHGVGHLVYDSNGDVYPSEDARTLGIQGDPMFLLGRAGTLSYKACVTHPTLRTLAMASLLECLPGFTDHWTTPFCGADPVAAYAAGGDVFPRLASSVDARTEITMVTALVERMVRDGAHQQAMTRWIA